MRGSVALDRFTGAGSEGPAHDPVDAHDDSVSFAVLVPLFAVDGEATVLLIRRAARLRRDAGHVAFPGGRVEPGERPLEAALREATEEIGLDPAQVTVVRRLQVVERPDGDRIAAFLGVLAERPVLTLNWEEVEAVIELPLAALLADGVGWQERWSLGGDERRIHFFADPSTLGEDLIWGLTAGILWSLLEGAIPATEVPASPDPTE
jgi:8-oxo-dGTP pyrophosphatase MutT (NUDIX family)